MSNILEIKNLRKEYKTLSENLLILNDLNMSIEAGKKVVVLGKSGSGKSTLLNIIGGLDNATSGNVFVNGIDICSLDEKKLSVYRKNTLGLIFQFHYLLKDFTALENIYLPALMAGVPKKQALEKASLLLHDVGLDERKNHLPSQLSGGERQRVAVARSLINDPELILADEPTGNLDMQNAKIISELLFKMADQYSKTLILVTHDLNIASCGDVSYSLVNGVLEN